MSSPPFLFFIAALLIPILVRDTSAFISELSYVRSTASINRFMSGRSELDSSPFPPNNGVTEATSQTDLFDASAYAETSSAQKIEMLSSRDPYVSIENAPSNGRRIYTGVDIMAEMSSIWDVLTAFDRLQEVVPSLVKNEVLFRTPEGGARLAQVGGAKVLPGVTFTAKTVLDVTVFSESNSMPDTMLTNREEKMAAFVRGVFPRPDSILCLPHRDIAIQNVLGEGDFEHYQGVWRMQSLPNCAPDGGNAARLTYAVEIKPKGFLPVKMIEGRIASDLKANLAAIRDHVEGEADAQKLLKLSQQLEEPEALIIDGYSDIESTQLQCPTEEQDTELDPNSAFQMEAQAETIPLKASIDAYEIMSLMDSTESHIMTDTPPADVEVQVNMAAERAAELDVDNLQLIFENESIQRVVAALEKDLGCALAKIHMIGMLSRGAVLDSEATRA